MSTWGTGAFENDCAREWFFRVEEAVDPGEVITAALDGAVAEAGALDLECSCEAIAAAELSASCAGLPSEGLPDQVRRWVGEHPHAPFSGETEQTTQAVQRIRVESELRDLWDEEMGSENMWLREIDELLERLKRVGTDGPTLRP